MKVWGGGRYLAESNAILAYLADGSRLLGTDRYERALVLQWMFFEQYSHEPNIATSRFIIRYLGNPPDRQAALAEKHTAGHRALGVMEQRLAAGEFMAGDRFTFRADESDRLRDEPPPTLWNARAAATIRRGNPQTDREVRPFTVLRVCHLTTRSFDYEHLCWKSFLRHH